jgi:DNA-binding IclR family transcriptional regulator
VETSKTADQALALLLELGREPGQTPADIARSLGLNRTVVHRLLATLEGRGFVRRASKDPTFVLGAALLELAQRAEPELRSLAEPAMQELARTVGETVLLFAPAPRLVPPQATVVAQVLGDRHVIRVQYDMAHLIPLTLSAGGRVLLAFSDPQTTSLAIASSDDPATVERQLAEIRRAGIAYSEDELLAGVTGVAAPVLGVDTYAVASLVIAAPSNRRAHLDSMVDQLVHTARSLGELVARSQSTA